jgi:hypothetical protein
MKLPIKKKYFDLIKNGNKNLEYREAHITFICEETGETLRKEIIHAEILSEKVSNQIRLVIEDNISLGESGSLISFTLGTKHEP